MTSGDEDGVYVGGRVVVRVGGNELLLEQSVGRRGDSSRDWFFGGREDAELHWMIVLENVEHIERTTDIEELRREPSQPPCGEARSSPAHLQPSGLYQSNETVLHYSLGSLGRGRRPDGRARQS